MPAGGADLRLCDLKPGMREADGARFRFGDITISDTDFISADLSDAELTCEQSGIGGRFPL